MDPTRLEALLQAVREVQESVSRLEREIMGALGEDRDQVRSQTVQPQGDGEILTLVELEKWLKVSRTTIYRLLSTKEIPSYRIGRAVRVRRSEVEEWLGRNRD